MKCWSAPDSVVRTTLAIERGAGGPRHGVGAASIIVESADVFTAVLWDLGGVILSSPFDAFARYERANGLPAGFLRSVNTVDSDRNSWARLERSELTTVDFDAAFAVESRALGHEVPGRDVLPLLAGHPRPRMVLALDTIKAAGYAQACLTNNVADAAIGPGAIPDVMARFDIVVESAKVGVRKPERRFYEVACELLGVLPAECVYLDDLGVNLKPARAMGMATIKVTDADAALRELGALLDVDL
jgi:putative hydrolase of the HAD superfamily